VTTILDIAQKLSGVSLGTLLLVILWGSYKQIWTWGRDLNAMTADRDEWKKLALQSLGAAEKAVQHAARLSGPPSGPPG
jgi:hypothetical protein